MRKELTLWLACALASCANVSEVRRADGSLAASGALQHGLQRGTWTHYHPDGSKQAEGPCKDDLQQGEWTWWRPDGSLEQRGSFERSMKVGEWRSWRADGSVASAGTCAEGLEQGPWSFWRADGTLERQGWYHRGSPEGLWRTNDASGALAGLGHYRGGVLCGDWLVRRDDGAWTRATYPTPNDVTLVTERSRAPQSPAEEADVRLVRRAGALVGGRKQGLWTGQHAAGSIWLGAQFESDQPQGLVQACDAGGRLLAEGSVRQGALVERWRFATAEGWREETYELPRPRRAHDGSWSQASVESSAGDGVLLIDAASIERWLAELASPLQPPPSLPAAPVADAPLRERLEAAPPAPPPARAQPWTAYERQILPRLIELYATGSASATDTDGYQVAAGRSVALRKPQDVARPGEHLGHRLPLTRFTRAGSSEPFDLDALRGERNVLLVILRGFGGQVCIYCTAQLKALGKERARLERGDTEVCIVYPGPRSGLDAFLEAWNLTFGYGQQPPWTMLYDADLQLVDALGLRDNIAVPSSLLLDKQGVVRWSHVGQNHADRPAATEILEQIEALERP